MNTYIKPVIETTRISMSLALMAGSVRTNSESGDVESVTSGSDDYDPNKGSYFGKGGYSIWDDEE